MRYLATGAEIAAIDRYTIEEIGIPSMVLMERAALSVVEEMLPHLEQHDRIWVACGTGNNGADGIAAARMLYQKGYQVLVIWAGAEAQASTQWKQQYEIGEKLGLSMVSFEEFIPGTCDVLVDAVFGVGLSRNVEGVYKEFLEMLIQSRPAWTVAVDIPSGIHSTTGAVMGIALKADLTVTFGYEKLGTCFYPGREYAGQVEVKDIGLASRRPHDFTWEKSDLKLIPVRKPYGNKGTFGKILIVAGSENMGGAAYLSALAAYRTGAGLVRIFTVEENRRILQTLLPEAVLETYCPSDFETQPEAMEKRIEKLCSCCDVVVAGPGLGQEPYVETLTEWIMAHAYVPIILDADGLNAVARCQRLTGYFTENVIITPHLGEMARLTGKTVEEIQDHLKETAQQYAGEYGVTCVLKDAVTVASGKEGQTYINTSGNSAMAKAGSGDVLTGIIAGLLALGMEEFQAASMGVYVHGLSGDLVKCQKGAHSLLAGELADAVSEVLQYSIEQQREI